MAYASADDVIRRYNPINSMIGTASMQVSTVDIASIYIRDAESIINAHLARRYVLPLAEEALLTDLTSDIAIYRLLVDRAPRLPDFMEKRYANAMTLLEKLQKGQMDLVSSSTSINSGAGDQYAWSNVAEDGRNGPVFKDAESLDPLCISSADYFSR